MKCCSPGCKRSAAFAPKIVIPHSATGPVKADLAFEMLERSPVCRKHFHHIDACVRLRDPKFLDFVVRLALTQAMRLGRQYEAPDFARAFLVKVDVASDEYRTSVAA
mgnify:CR=1 FL=1